jgi:hypothetical protein
MAGTRDPPVWPLVLGSGGKIRAQSAVSLVHSYALVFAVLQC